MNQLTEYNQQPSLIPGFSNEDVNTILDMFDPKRKFTQSQLKLFFYLCKERGLDPRLGQVRPIPRWNKETGQSDLSIVTTIEGFRAMAERTGCYAPGKKTEYTRDENGKIISAIAYIKKRTQDGIWHEIGEECFISEYMPEKNNFFWLKMPSVMTAKVSEVRGLRRAFPEVFSKIYSEDEMAQSNNSYKENNNKEFEAFTPKEVERIDDEQYHTLLSLINNNAELKDGVLKYMKIKYQIDDLTRMPVEAYSTVINRLKERMEEQEAVND